MADILEIELSEQLKLAKQAQNFVFVLNNRNDSTWVNKEDYDKRKESPRRLNSPKFMYLPMQSRRWDPNIKRAVKTMYIAGAPTDRIEDYFAYDEKNGKPLLGDDKKPIKKLGLKSLGYNLDEELKLSKQMNVKFKSGILNVAEKGLDMQLLDFVNNHELNTDNPYAKELAAANRNRNMQFSFAPLKKEEKAASRLITLDRKADALNFIKSLRVKSGDRYIFQREKINAVLVMIGVSVNQYSEDEDNLKLEKIMSIGEHSLVAFLDVVEETMENYKLQIGIAQEFNILTLGKEAKMNIKTESRHLLTFKETGKDKNIEELCLYFIGDKKGQNEFATMVQEVDLKKAIAARN